jgi:hypothetical protein rflaF_05844
MIRFTGLTFDPNFKKKSESNFENAQKFIDSEVLRLSEPYVPYRNGKLKESGTLGTVIGSGIVEYIAPYARDQYYNNAGRGTDGLNAAHGVKGLRGKLWFERMKADHLDEIEKGVKEKFT